MFKYGRIRERRRPEERYVDAAVTHHDCFSVGSVTVTLRSVMVWDGISIRHRTPQHLVQDSLTGVSYRDTIIWPMVLPALQTVFNGEIFMDDNSLCDCAAVVNNVLQQQVMIR